MENLQIYMTIYIFSLTGAWELPLKNLPELFRPFKCGEENQCRGCEHCDDMCKFYNNSCCNTRNEPLYPNLEKWQYECTRIYPDMEKMGFDCNGMNTGNTTADGVLMVTRCPLSSTASENQIKCERETDSLLARIPVYDIDREYITYKNVYCALCNDIFQSRLKFWENEIQCNFSENIDVITNFDSNLCVTYFVFRTSLEMKFRWCTINMIETCPQFYHSNKSVIDMRDRCENGQTGPVMIGYQSFKNEDCWICNSFNLTERAINRLFGVFLTYDDPFRTSICDSGYNTCYDELPSYSLKQLVNLNIEETNENNMLLNGLKDNNILRNSVQNGSCTSCADFQCHHYKIAEKEVRINETGLYLKSVDIFFTKDRYFVNGTNIYLCLDDNQRMYLMKTKTNYNIGDDFVEKALTLISLLVSLTCLFMTFLLYVCFKKLRNDHGNIMMNLVVSLFFAQLSFLVSSSFQNIRPACVLFGIFTHYFFLVAFCSMNAVGFHSFKTFSNLYASGSRGHRVWLGMLYCWALPLLIVLTALILDHVYLPENEAFLSPRFGKTACWINSSKALLIFFIIPLGIFKMIDLFFFSITAVIIAKHIRQGSKLNSGVARKQSPCTFLINLKLALIMGLSWLFSFLATSVDHFLLWYLFILCNSLQGLFIFLSLTCSRNVCTLMNQKIRGFSRRSVTENTNT